MNSQREHAVTEAFVGLADTLVADYDVIDLLYRLSESCVELLGVAAAGMLLSDQRGNLTPLAVTEGTRLLELTQLQNDEGPCLDCFHTGATVSCADLTDPDAITRWPRFSEAARREGFVSVHALPLRLRDQTIGALNLFDHSPGALPDQDLRLAQALADVSTIGILQERALRHGEILVEQLQSALNSRITIEQAKGLLAGRSELSTDEAFERLRRHARDHQRRLSELARDVLNGAVAVEDVLGPAAPGRAAAPRK